MDFCVEKKSKVSGFVVQIRHNNSEGAKSGVRLLQVIGSLMNEKGDFTEMKPIFKFILPKVSKDLTSLLYYLPSPIPPYNVYSFEFSDNYGAKQLAVPKITLFSTV